MRRALKYAAWLLAGCLGLVALATLTLFTPPGRALVAAWVGDLASSNGQVIHIGRIDGNLLTAPILHDLTLADQQGVWLTMDRAAMIWRPVSLLSGRVEISRVDIHQISVDHWPQSTASPAPAKANSDQTGLPTIALEQLAIARLVLGTAIAGRSAMLSVDGGLTADQNFIRSNIHIKRIDGTAGQLSAKLDWQSAARQLTMSLAASEPAGGIISRLAGLNQNTGLALDLHGRGPIDDWRAELSLKAGEKTALSGEMRLQQAAGLRLDMALAGALTPLLPPSRQALVAGDSRLSVAATMAPDGAVTVHELTLTSAAMTAKADGTIAADRTLDLKLDLTARPILASLLPKSVSWSDLRMAMQAQGPLATPQITGHANLRDVTWPQAPLGPIGKTLRLDFAGRLDSSMGLADADLTLATAGNTLRYQGDLSADRLSGTVTATSPDLAAFSALAGRPLKGSGTVKLTLSGSPQNSISAKVDAQAAGLTFLPPALHQARLTGQIARDAAGAFQLSDGVVEADGLHLTLSAGAKADLSAPSANGHLIIDDLAQFDARLSGRANAALSLDQAAFSAMISLPKGAVMGRALTDAALTITAKDPLTKPNGSLSMTGQLDGRPISGSADLGGTSDDLIISNLNLAAGSVHLTGGLQRSGQIVTGTLSLVAGDLADVAPLLLTPIAGALKAKIELSAPDGVQAVDATAEGQGLTYDQTRIGGLNGTLHIGDMQSLSGLTGDVTVTAVTSGTERLDRGRLTVVGDAKSQQVTLLARGPDLAIDGAGQLATQAGETQLNLSHLKLTARGTTAQLEKPAQLTLAHGRLTIGDAVIAIDRGRLMIAGTMGEALDLKLRLNGLPLAALKSVTGIAELKGQITGQLALAGTLASPTGPYDLTITGLSTAAAQSAGLPPLDVMAKGRLAGDRSELTVTARTKSGLELTANGRVPLSSGGAIDLKIAGRGDLTVLNPILPSSAAASGPVTLDMSVTGPATKPQASGQLRVTGGHYRDSGLGVDYKDIGLVVSANQSRLTIESFSAAAQGGGAVTASGTIDLDFTRNLPVQMIIKAKDLHAVQSRLLLAVIDADLTLAGALLNIPTLSGKIDLHQAEINLPERRDSRVTAIAVEHQNAPKAVEAALERRETARRHRSKAGPTLAFDLEIDGGNRIIVRGMGLDAVLGGHLRLRGTDQAPSPAGSFTLQRGRFALLGQTLKLTQGEIRLLDTLDAGLDFAAETSSGGFIARVLLTGTATKPILAFESSPPLPADEVISRLLFNKASGDLSIGEAVQLARSVASLLGTPGASGGGIIDDARKTLGLDTLDVDQNSVGIGRYLNDNTYVDVSQGATPGSGQVTVDIDVTDKIKARGGIGSDGSSSVGVAVEWEY